MAAWLLFGGMLFCAVWVFARALLETFFLVQDRKDKKRTGGPKP
jgi:hypothetical protein